MRSTELAQARLTALSDYFDGNYPQTLASEAVLWRRTAKVVEESGEAIAALYGMLGENARKGVTHTLDDLVDELADVAVAALGAIEHARGNSGVAFEVLDARIAYVYHRAGEPGAATQEG